MKTFNETLTFGNIEFVANLILRMLSGKKYTFVSVYEYKNFVPETRLHQELKNGPNDSPLSIYFDTKSSPSQFAGFNFCDTYGVWGLSTSLKNDYYDTGFNTPHIVVDWNSITITLRTPAGLLAHWQITVE